MPDSGAMKRRLWLQWVSASVVGATVIALVDLNKDGKQEIVTHHSPTTGPHRVVMLIAR